MDRQSICRCLVATTYERVQIDWHWPLSGVHTIVMVNSAQPVVGGGPARPPPFTLSTITSCGVRSS
jgi:hypothetical protein